MFNNSNFINENQISRATEIKYGQLSKLNISNNKSTDTMFYDIHTSNSSNINHFLGVDRIKIRIPTTLLKINYSKYFKKSRIYINSTKDLYSVTYKFVKSVYKYTNLKIKHSSKDSDRNYEHSNYLEIDFNVPKLIHGNNVYESTNEDLINAVYRLNSLLSEIVDINKIFTQDTAYLEIGINIIVDNANDSIELLYRNTRSWRNTIKTKTYDNGGFSFGISNLHKKLSYYNKISEVEFNDPNNYVLPLLKKHNTKQFVIRIEQKYANKQEIKKLAEKYLGKSYLSLKDFLSADISSKILNDVWRQHKEHMNIFDLTKANTTEIISYINKSKLSTKMKSALLQLINGLINNITFDDIYNSLKKTYSKNFPCTVIHKYKEIMTHFNVPVFNLISVIEKELLRTYPFQHYLYNFNNLCNVEARDKHIDTIKRKRILTKEDVF